MLHARDLGLCYATNAAIEDLIDQGVVSSTSVMAPCPWFEDAAAAMKPRQAGDTPVDIGLQLTLNSNLLRYRWKPVATRDLAASLVGPHGRLWPTVLQTTVNADTADIAHELEAQLAKAQRAGITPTHLTTHLGTLFSRPDFARAYLNFARRHWIPAVVVELTSAKIDFFQRQGFPLPNELLAIVDEYPLPKVDDLKFLPRTETLDEKRERAFELIQALQPGLTQVTLAPATKGPALKRIDEQWRQRVWDRQLLADAALKQRLQEQGVIFTNWREIMQRFEGRQQ